MTINWSDWQRLRDSLDYSWERMQALDPCGNAADREEYASLADAALRIASRLVQSSGADVPALDTAATRAQWMVESRRASVVRELIVEHDDATRRRLEDAESRLADA
jgi:hypothetical protein